MAVFVQHADTGFSDEYRRKARELRGRWADNPARRQQALAGLARQTDASTPQGLLPDHALREPMVARQFAAEICPELACGPLRYSRRCKLLKRAEALGIERFEANLIIAALQHHSNRITSVPSDRSSAVRPILIALVIELALLFAAIYLWF